MCPSRTSGTSRTHRVRSGSSTWTTCCLMTRLQGERSRRLTLPPGSPRSSRRSSRRTSKSGMRWSDRSLSRISSLSLTSHSMWMSSSSPEENALDPCQSLTRRSRYHAKNIGRSVTTSEIWPRAWMTVLMGRVTSSGTMHPPGT